MKANIFRKIEELTYDCASQITCRLKGMYTNDGKLILRLEDGTISTITSVEYLGHDVETPEQAANNKYWIDVWCDNDQIGSYIRRLRLDPGDLIHVSMLRCVEVANENGVFVYR